MNIQVCDEMFSLRRTSDVKRKYQIVSEAFVNAMGYAYYPPKTDFLSARNCFIQFVEDGWHQKVERQSHEERPKLKYYL